MLPQTSERERDDPEAALARLNEARAEAWRRLWDETEAWRAFIGTGDIPGLYRAFGQMRAAEQLAHDAEDALDAWRIRRYRSQRQEQERVAA